MNIKWLSITSGVILLLGILNWPYGYYILLRWTIFLSAATVSYTFYKNKSTSWALIFGAVVFLFNPLAPIYLNKSIWVFLDFITAIIFFLAVSHMKQE